MSNRWQVQGSYVWSRLDGAQTGINTNGTAARTAYDFTNPNNTIDSARPGPRRQRSTARLQAARQLPGALGHQRRRELPGAQRSADRPEPDRARSRRARATSPVDQRGTYRAELRSTCCRCAPTRAFRFSGHRASFVVELHNVLNSSAGQSSYGALTQSYASQAAFDAARADDVVLRPHPGDRRAARDEDRVQVRVLERVLGAL